LVNKDRQALSSHRFIHVDAGRSMDIENGWILVFARIGFVHRYR
jgi:hypothetical protein